MPKFEIDVTRVGVGFATISVEADSLKDAQQRALDEAGNHEFSEKASEYELTHGGPAEGAGRALADVSSDGLVEELRRRGVAVCAFTPRDIVECGRGLDEEASAGVLRAVADKFAEAATELGWQIIDRQVAAVMRARQDHGDDFVEVALVYDAFDELESAGRLSAEGPSEEVPLDRVDLSLLEGCEVRSIQVSYPDAARYGVPEHATERGAQAYVLRLGFDFSRNMEVDAMDTGDDTPGSCRLVLWAPVAAIGQCPSRDEPVERHT